MERPRARRGRRKPKNQVVLWEDGAKPLGTTGGRSLASAPAKEKTGGPNEGLLEKVLDGRNMVLALRRAVENRGAPGVDGMTVKELGPYLCERWAAVRQVILDGAKPGAVRMLGVPTALDRLLQQMLHQVLASAFEPGFSAYSTAWSDTWGSGSGSR